MKKCKHGLVSASKMFYFVFKAVSKKDNLLSKLISTTTIKS